MQDRGRITNTQTEELADLIQREHAPLLDQWRALVRELPSARQLDTPTLNDHIPNLIQELATALRSGSEQSIAEVVEEGTPPDHGVQRYQDGFDIDEVVAEYNILRGCVHDLAERNDLQLQGKPFHILNRVLDGAIGAAVQAFADQQAHEVRRRREEYLAFVAHDLRTPLNAIGLALTFLERGGGQRSEPPADVDVMWKILRRNVRQLEGMVGRILVENVDFQLEAGLKVEQRVVDLWALVETVCTDLQPVAEAPGTRLVNEVPADMLAFVDGGMVRRILQNLIANAISYAPGGEVRISATPLPGGKQIECRVKDDGAGIPAHRIDSIFQKLDADPGNDSGSGLGLGLAIVKAFVEAHGGNVSVESNPGQGACFCFTVPAARNVPA